MLLKFLLFYSYKNIKYILIRKQNIGVFTVVLTQEELECHTMYYHTKPVAAHMDFRLQAAVARVGNRTFRRNSYMV